jgi:hypothetical protein
MPERRPRAKVRTARDACTGWVGSDGPAIRGRASSESYGSLRPCPPASGRPANRADRTVRAAAGQKQWDDLVDWTGQVPSSGEKPRPESGFRSRCPCAVSRSACEPWPNLRLCAAGTGAENGSLEADWSSDRDSERHPQAAQLRS